MLKRRKTQPVTVKDVTIGSESPIVIQSMTKVATTDVEKCLEQINQLVDEGCGLVRLAVPTRLDTQAFAKIVEKSPIPLVADVHFSADRAVEAIENGAAKIRLNPGNIKDKKDINHIIDCAKFHKIAIRVGVNEASIRDLKAGDIEADKRVDLMLAEMKKYVKLFEHKDFTNIVLSAKSADTMRTIEINRAMAKVFDYPIHIGLTHAGLLEDATVPSSVAIGALLSEGIGDTIRVSVAGDPVAEIILAKKILRSLGLYPKCGPELIVCPTCGRCQIDVVNLAQQVRKAIVHNPKNIHVAVMGCIVNGPGEAADADVAVCAAAGKGYIYIGGKKKAVVPEADLIDELLRQIEKF